METLQPVPVFERINRWISESVTIKLFSIGFLVLLLLIPQSWIESLIRERQDRAESVVREVASKWSGEQVITGPVLVIPFLQHEKIDKGKDGIELRTWKSTAYFLPEQLKVTGKVNPQVLHRGIFDAAVYESALQLSATFLPPDFQHLNISPEDVLWSESHLTLGIRDLRGISETPKILVDDKPLTGEPSNSTGVSAQLPSPTADDTDSRRLRAPDADTQTGIDVRLPWQNAPDFRGNTSVNLHLKGSTLLYFVPAGKTTEVNLSGPWPNPSFDGEFIPASRKISEAGFDADWKVLHFNRPFSQQWTGTSQRIAGSEFGVRLLIPVDQYQKSIRTAKYGILVILLSFISLLMVEIIKKIRIHPFQYILVGAALIIYYSLLLSLSEQLGYDWAYLASSLATVALVTGYSITFLTDKKTVTLFGGLLTIFYGFIFVIIQQQDYSLLLGSIGLFIIVAFIMYFSRNIQWYHKENR